jgi:hypothetical protein
MRLHVPQRTRVPHYCALSTAGLPVRQVGPKAPRLRKRQLLDPRPGRVGAGPARPAHPAARWRPTRCRAATRTPRPRPAGRPGRRRSASGSRTARRVRRAPSLPGLDEGGRAGRRPGQVEIGHLRPGHGAEHQRSHHPEVAGAGPRSPALRRGSARRPRPVGRSRRGLPGPELGDQRRKPVVGVARRLLAQRVNQGVRDARCGRPQRTGDGEPAFRNVLTPLWTPLAHPRTRAPARSRLGLRVRRAARPDGARGRFPR